MQRNSKQSKIKIKIISFRQICKTFNISVKYHSSEQFGEYNLYIHCNLL